MKYIKMTVPAHICQTILIALVLDTIAIAKVRLQRQRDGIQDIKSMGVSTVRDRAIPGNQPSINACSGLAVLNISLRFEYCEYLIIKLYLSQKRAK